MPYGQGYKPLTGYHLQWAGERSLALDVKVRKLEKVSEFIQEVRQTAQAWMQHKGITPTRDRTAPCFPQGGQLIPPVSNARFFQ